MTDICDNVRIVRERIAEAAARSGRNACDVRLVGVTKTVGVARINEMLACGVKDIGENRAQEMTSKYPELADENLNWHMIGSLQKNKVKFVVDKVFLIHSVDSYGLAAEIDRISIKAQKISDILIEVNVAGEASKSGVAPGSCAELIKSISQLEHINVKGLMTVAPYAEKPEKTRVYFKKMYELYVDILEKCVNVVIADDFNVLSMGMTNDYAVAVEEGSTMVRVGSGIFGARS